jgi:AcrR family transcriptional regulator
MSVARSTPVGRFFRVTSATTRRERLRAATVQEIKDAARRLLVADGAQAVTLRAVARALGLSAPALYRYFPSHEDLVSALIVDYFDELTAAMCAERDRLPGDDPAGRLLAVAREFRRWAVTHPGEFGLVFGSPVPDLLTQHEDLDPCHQAGLRFGAVFIELISALWTRQPFPVPDEGDLDPQLVRQLTARREIFGGMPVGAAYVLLTCWSRLYGLVCMEVFDHLHWALDEVEPFYEAQLHELGMRLQIKP